MVRYIPMLHVSKSCVRMYAYECIFMQGGHAALHREELPTTIELDKHVALSRGGLLRTCACLFLLVLALSGGRLMHALSRGWILHLCACLCMHCPRVWLPCTCTTPPGHAAAKDARTSAKDAGQGGGHVGVGGA